MRAVMPTPEQLAVLKELGLTRGKDVMIVLPNVVEALKQKGVKDPLQALSAMDYSHDSQPDSAAEYVDSLEHHAVQTLLNDDEDED